MLSERRSPPRSTSIAATFASRPIPATISIGTAWTCASARRREPADRLDRDRDRDHREQHAVQQRREHLDALEAERVPIGRGTRRHHGRDERDDQPDGVARHVPGVGEQRERSGEEGADDLRDEDGRDDGQGDREAGAVAPRSVPVIVAHASRVGARGGRDRAVEISAVPRAQHLDERAERPRAMALRVLLVGGELGRRDLEALRAGTPGRTRIRRCRPAPRAPSPARPRARRARTSPSTSAAAQTNVAVRSTTPRRFVEQVRDVVGVDPRARIARRVDAGGAAQRVDRDAGVVRDRGEPGVLGRRPRLDERVRRERRRRPRSAPGPS